MIGDAYDDVEGYVAEADLGLGCGQPTEYANLSPGQTVLDLGAGAGLDAFVARRIVGASAIKCCYAARGIRATGGRIDVAELPNTKAIALCDKRALFHGRSTLISWADAF